MPYMQFGVRHDGGDGEGGSRLEFGGGLRYASAGGRVGLEAWGRSLRAHSADSGYKESGYGVMARVSSRADGQGLSLMVVPRWGAGASGFGAGGFGGGSGFGTSGSAGGASGFGSSGGFDGFGSGGFGGASGSASGFGVTGGAAGSGGLASGAAGSGGLASGAAGSGGLASGSASGNGNYDSASAGNIYGAGGGFGNASGTSDGFGSGGFSASGGNPFGSDMALPASAMGNWGDFGDAGDGIGLSNDWGINARLAYGIDGIGISQWQGMLRPYTTWQLGADGDERLAAGIAWNNIATTPNAMRLRLSIEAQSERSGGNGDNGISIDNGIGNINDGTNSNANRQSKRNTGIKALMRLRF